ncbi:MAG: hypothetical protein U1F11_09045 [Steroidobacteraceae bacterium]
MTLTGPPAAAGPRLFGRRRAERQRGEACGTAAEQVLPAWHRWKFPVVTIAHAAPHQLESRWAEYRARLLAAIPRCRGDGRPLAARAVRPGLRRARPSLPGCGCASGCTCKQDSSTLRELAGLLRARFPLAALVCITSDAILLRDLVHLRDVRLTWSMPADCSRLPRYDLGRRLDMVPHQRARCA